MTNLTDNEKNSIADLIVKKMAEQDEQSELAYLAKQESKKLWTRFKKVVHNATAPTTNTEV